MAGPAAENSLLHCPVPVHRIKKQPVHSGRAVLDAQAGSSYVQALIIHP